MKSSILMAGARLLFAGLLLALCPAVAWGEDPQDPPEPVENPAPWQDLGVDEPLINVERKLIKDQIRTFIPPLLRGFSPMHAFTLPPNTFEAALTARVTAIGGDDFFSGGEENIAAFGDFDVERLFLDLSLFYGFDLGKKYLHNFTAFLNVPFLASRTDGALHPNGVGLIDVMNRGSTQELGDISLFIKKKVVDQANFPVGIAVMGGVFFPTGANDERFSADGLVATRAPTLPSGGPMPVGVPLPMSVLAGLPRTVGQFPFNDGVFNRFSDDGRLPSVLQPGDGAMSYQVGVFLTRQFLPGDLPLLRRGALHFGTTQRFRQKAEGVDRGDLNTHQLTFVLPLKKDYVSLEVGYFGTYQSADHYDGTFITPFFTDAAGTNVSSGATHVTFKEVSRPSFTRGEWGNLVTSLIVSPDPQVRFVATLLTRVVEPDLGPAPPNVLRLSLSALF